MNRFLKIFISAGMAISLLVLLGGVLIFATIYESQHGTPAVQRLVYKTWWFVGLLGIIFLNVLFASLSRLPFKKEHLGFHITHLGLLILLFGSMLTCLVGEEGRMILAEGETGDRIYTDSEQALFWREGDARAHLLERAFTQKLNRRPWRRNILNGEIEVSIDGFSPDSRLESAFESSREGGNPKIQAVLFNSFVNQPFWIGPGESLQIGPALVRCEKKESAEEFKNLLKPSPEALEKKQSRGELILSLPDKQIVASFPVEGLLGGKQKIEGTPLTVKGLKFYPHALVENNKLVNHSDDLVNPAVEFEIDGPQGVEKHVAFSLFPQFASLHGKTSKNYEVQAHYVLEVPPSKPAGRTLTLFISPENQLAYQVVTKEGELRTGTLALKTPVETGWMDLKLEAKKFYASARGKNWVSPLPLNPDKPNPVPALHFTFKNLMNLTRVETWVSKDSEAKIPFGENRWVIRYGAKEVPLGFQLQLKDFVLKRYLGSDQPMSYESFVEVQDLKKNKKFPFHIHMNHPLVYNGYKFFQASYTQNPGEPEVSIFAVKRDPGVPLIYGGSAILIAGILILFYGKPKEKEKTRKKK